MNENYEQLVARFVAGETLSSAEYELLRDMMTNDPSLVHHINDDRAIDAILRSESLSDEQFVAKCVNRYRQLDLDLPTQRETTKDVRSRLPTNNNLSSFRDRQHQRLSDSDIDLDSLNAGVPPTVSPAETPGTESTELSNTDNAPNGFASNITSASADHLHAADSQKTESPGLRPGLDTVEVNQADGLDTDSVRRASVKTTSGSKRVVWLAAIAAVLLAMVTAGIWMSQFGTENGAANVEGIDGVERPEQNKIAAVPGDGNQNGPSQIVADEGDSETPTEPEQVVGSETDVLIEKGTANPAIDVLDSDNIAPEAPTGFATIYPGKAIWEKLPWKEGVDFSNGVAVNAVRLELRSGAASVKFDNGARLDLLGKCVGEIVAERTIVLQSGVFTLSVPAALENFSVNAGTTQLFASDSLNAQVVIDDQGVLETYLFDGKLNMLRSGAPAETAIRLTKDGLQQVVMSPDLGRAELPSITMARGGKRFFVGQLGVEKSFLKVDSPPIFAQLMNQLVPAVTKPGDSGQTELENQFDQAFRGFAGTEDTQQSMSIPGKPLDKKNDAQQFSGAIIFNGTAQKFDSLKTYTEAIGEQFELLNFRSPQSPLRLQSQSAEDIDLGFEINGMTLKFSDLELLEQRREKMEEASPSNYR